MPPRHTHVPPVQNNQPGTGFGSRGKSVGLGPSVTPLGLLSAPRMSARGAIWAHIQIICRMEECSILFDIILSHSHLGNIIYAYILLSYSPRIVLYILYPIFSYM